GEYAQAALNPARLCNEPIHVSWLIAQAPGALLAVVHQHLPVADLRSRSDDATHAPGEIGEPELPEPGNRVPEPRDVRRRVVPAGGQQPLQPIRVKTELLSRDPHRPFSTATRVVVRIYRSPVPAERAVQREVVQA